LLIAKIVSIPEADANVLSAFGLEGQAGEACRLTCL
jgi:hypothetical protein